MQPEIPANYLDTKGAAAYLDCSKSFLDQRRVSGDGPRYSKLGHSVRYKRDDLDAWMVANSRHSTGEYAARTDITSGRAVQ
jgi:predicted DNA-binding transcriptional regulator AlpA